MPDPGPAVADLAGVWHRSLLIDADGGRDTTTTVTWIQGPSRYVDLRQPPRQPPRQRPSQRPLAELRPDELRELARQEGFAGRLDRVDGLIHWHRAVDFNPTGTPDAGRLRWDGAVLVEEGVYAAYREHWRRRGAAGSGSAPPPSAAVELTDPLTGDVALLVRAGSWFGYARGRATPLPPGRRLPEAVRSADGPAAAVEMLDCEISIGRIAAGRWRIERSTLPHRAGCSPRPTTAGAGGLLLADADRAGQPYLRRWTVTAAEGDLAVLAARGA